MALTSWAWSLSFWSAYRLANRLISAVNLRSLPDVAVDGYRVAGAGVGAGEGPAARGGELGEAGSDQLSGRDDLHVAELPDAAVPFRAASPSRRRCRWRCCTLRSPLITRSP